MKAGSDDFICQSSGYQIVNFLEDIIFNINDNNIELSVQTTLNLQDASYIFSYNLIICRLVFSAFISQRKEATLYFEFLKAIQMNEEISKTICNDSIIEIFSQFLLKLNRQESYYLLEKMIEQELIDPSSIQKQQSLYFSHYKTKEEIASLQSNQFWKQFSSNIDVLEKDNWEFHKRYAREGVNPLEIAKIIRNDDVEKLQELSSQTSFNFQQTIEPSLYERYSFINKENISLIDYAAFFGSVKCFKFLIVNGSSIKNTGVFAVAGGNLEIFYICVQNHSSFDRSYETAIEYHRNDIFFYLYQNKIGNIGMTRKLGKQCIFCNNFEILSFLIEKGMKIGGYIIKRSARVGNFFLTKHFIEFSKIPKTILVESVESRNIELVKYILEQKGVRLNSKNVMFESALMKACLENSIEIVKLLLEQEGIDVNTNDICMIYFMYFSII